MSNPSNRYLDSQKASIIKKIQTMEKSMPSYTKDFFSYYLSVKNAQPRTVLGYAYDLDVFFYYITESNPSIRDAVSVSVDILDNLEAQDIQEYLVFLTSYERGGKTYQNSATGKARKLSALRSLYKYLQNMKMLKNNPTVLIPNPKLKKKAIIMMENDEVEDFVDNVESGETLTAKQKEACNKMKERDIAIVTLLLRTGIRISELVGLDLDDINMKNRSIRIIRKGGNESYAYFDEEAMYAIQSYLDNERPKDTSLTALFISRKGSRLSVRSVERMIKKYSAVIPNKHITPHKLRSTFATQLYRETNDIYLVKDALGHESVNTTARYADIGNNRRQEVPKLIDKAYKLKLK